MRIRNVGTRFIGDHCVVDGDMNPRGIESDHHGIFSMWYDGIVGVLSKAIGSIGNIEHHLI